MLHMLLGPVFLYEEKNFKSLFSIYFDYYYIFNKAQIFNKKVTWSCLLVSEIVIQRTDCNKF